MASNEVKRRLIITGPPGTGKTTVVKTVCKFLSDRNVPVVGFYTEEVRKNGQRIGFDVVSLDGTRARLARSEESGEQFAATSHRVGKYSLLIKEFETVVLPIFEKVKKIAISPGSPVVVIDEIGKMELFSNRFAGNIKHLFTLKDLVILTTIPVAKGKPIPLVEAVRNDKASSLFTIDTTNRAQMPSTLLEIIISLQKL